jgi:CRISPR-associated endonuclease/helicase Cas3
MDGNVYAKIYYENGKPYGESLKDHTLNLITELDRLKKLYLSELKNLSLDESFFKALEIACLFHDLGKLSSQFQCKIKKILKEKCILPNNLTKEIPHNYLSGAFLYEKRKDIKNKGLKKYFKLIFYSVTFHHNRGIEFNEDYYKEIIVKDLSKNLDKLEWLKEFGFEFTKLGENETKASYNKIFEFYNNQHETEKIKKETKFILLKGLLHRLDHSASAKIKVEEDRIENLREKLIEKLKEKENFTGLKPFQERAKEYENKSILQVASTGMGKTEFAINWIGDSKAFYTLPIRVSVNAMYDRFTNYFGKNKVGLLHSDAIFYGIDKYEQVEEILSIEEHIIRTQATRHLSMPITITTADQLFTATLKYPGYEKIYSTLAYSKLVVDEPQSYSPDTLAIIIKGLQEISNIGGKFCFMSATIHPFVEEYLKDYCEVLPPEFDKEKKHKIKLLDKSIEELKDVILDIYKKRKKILIIVNTVRKSQELYQQLKEEYEDLNIKLLHSLFIQRDRKKKESEIQQDFKKGEPVIWITTQLVEASLDIDYNVLFTEIATLDALIQRMGRVYRRNGRTITDKDEPNIYIALANPSDKGKIYNKEIVEITKEALNSYNGKILTEEIKQSLMNEVFNKEKIENTKFYKKFKDNLELLESGFQAENKNEAQKLFREILNINVIPEDIFNTNQKEIENLIDTILDTSIPYPQRLKSLPIFRIKEQNPTAITPSKIRKQIYLINLLYDPELGLRLDKGKDNFEFL